MRIIAGEFKGKRLFTPKDSKIRPTTDKVKESIFNIIAPYIEDATVIDVFCGTGNLGLEALSRGAKSCFFGDKSRDSLELARQNIRHCKQESKAVTILGDYEYILKRINGKVDLIFLDPPYKNGIVVNCLELISKLSLLSEEGIIVVEHGAREKFEDELFGLHKIKERIFGTIAISIYRLDLEE